MRKGIKRILPVVLIIVFAMSMTLTGCGGNTKAISSAAEGLLKALQDGDVAKVAELASEEALTDGDFAFVDQMGNLSEYFLQSMNATEDELTEESKTAIDNLADTLVNDFVSSYKIGEVTEEEGIGYVSCTITYGYNPDSLDDSGYEDEVTSIVQKYTQDNMDELITYYNDNGQDALSKKIVNDVLPDVCDVILKHITESGEKTEKAILKVEKSDDRWIVTEAKLVEDSEEDGEGESNG